MAKNVIIRNNENTEIICSEVDTIILPTADGGTASFKDWNGVDTGSHANTMACCNNIIISPFGTLASASTNAKAKLITATATVTNLSSSFTLQNDGFYKSASIGHNSYCLCQVNLKLKNPTKVVFDCISYGESNFDYGILSNVNCTLTSSNASDTVNVFKSFYGLSSSNIQPVDYGIIPAGNSFIQVKYRKDSSQTAGTDSMSFRVNFFEEEQE